MATVPVNHVVPAQPIGLIDQDIESKSDDSDDKNDINKPQPKPLTSNQTLINLLTPKCLQQLNRPKINLSDDIKAINPDIHVLFNKYNTLYFDALISTCEIKWIDSNDNDNKDNNNKPKSKSKSKKKVRKKYGGRCIHDASGFCSIELDQAILQFKSTKYLIETLIHQMIHSYLYQMKSMHANTSSNHTQIKLNNIGHSDVFKLIMNKINQLSISSIKLSLNNKQCRHNDDYPSEIIPNDLYLGNIHHALDYNVLTNLGITHIVNCTQSIKNKFIDAGITYCRVPVNDKVNDSIMHFFVKAIRFIEGVRDDYNKNKNQNKMKHLSKPRIMIHCHAGISRSSTITVAYLMYSWHLTMFDAINYVASKRYIIQPNDGFKNQLLDFYLYLGQNEGNLDDFEQKNPAPPKPVPPPIAAPNPNPVPPPVAVAPPNPNPNPVPIIAPVIIKDKPKKHKSKQHVQCPVCQKYLPVKSINKHLDQCASI